MRIPQNVLGQGAFLHFVEYCFITKFVRSRLLCICSHKRERRVKFDMIPSAADIYGTILFCLGVVYLLMNFYVKFPKILAKRTDRQSLASKSCLLL